LFINVPLGKFEIGPENTDGTYLNESSPRSIDRYQLA
jgi:hypothetical protein